MYFSPATIAAVAGFIATASAAPSVGENADVHLAERGLLSSILGGGYSISTPQVPLCNKPNYGAIGKPWESNSTPAAFCGNKPSNSGAWKNIPTWDGGDKTKCNNWLASWGLNVCSNNGNKIRPLPWGCRPPKKGGNKPKPSTAAPTTAAPSTTAPGTTAPGTTAPGTTAPGTTAPSTTSTAAADPSASAPADDPYADPVCSGKYQMTFNNYTLVAPNGYWTGKVVGAAIQDASYLTYTLVAQLSDCLAACDNVEGCACKYTCHTSLLELYVPGNDLPERMGC